MGRKVPFPERGGYAAGAAAGGTGHITVREGLAHSLPTGRLLLRLLPPLNGNRQRAERRPGSAADLQRGSNKQELIHFILRQVF